MEKKVGILAIQGSFAEHGQVLERMGIDFVWVKDKATLESLTHLIIPGGESTTMRKLLEAYGMSTFPPAVFGTCAGAILLSDFMDIDIDRNAYGAQQESFIGDIEVQSISSQQPVTRSQFVKGVFIRAPRIMRVGAGVEVLAQRSSKAASSKEPVLVRQGKLLAATFHPELNDQTFIYDYFLNL